MLAGREAASLRAATNPRIDVKYEIPTRVPSHFAAPRLNPCSLRWGTSSRRGPIGKPRKSADGIQIRWRTPLRHQIGRASCREREKIEVVQGTGTKDKENRRNTN